MYTEESIEVFLKEQGRLYDEPVAETVEEAEEFLEDCMAVEVKNIKEVRKYLDEAGADVSGMSDEELEEACESFYTSIRWLSDRGRIRKFIKKTYIPGR